MKNEIKKPNMFLVGAPKSGTTSVYYYLKQHPDVFLPNRKELHFFSYPEVCDTYYRVDFITDIKTYLDFYSSAKNEKILADISPSYLYYCISAERIKKFNPEAKIVMILRNPIERAISHYLFDVKLGYQKNHLELCNYLKKTDNNRQYYKEYIEVGMYASKVKHFIDVFGRQSICVLLFDELSSNPKQFFQKLFSFLDIPDFKIDLNQQYNVYGTPKINMLYYIMHNDFLFRILKILPHKLKSQLSDLVIDTNVEKPKFEKEYSILRDLFHNDITSLSKIIDIDLSKWIINEQSCK